MTHRQVESSREVRLWFGQVVVPAVMLATTTLAIPEVRQVVATKARLLKESIERKFRKKTEL